MQCLHVRLQTARCSSCALAQHMLDVAPSRSVGAAASFNVEHMKRHSVCWLQLKAALCEPCSQGEDLT